MILPLAVISHLHQSAVCCSCQSIRTHRGDHETIREDISPHIFLIFGHQEKCAWRLQITASNSVSLYQQSKLHCIKQLISDTDNTTALSRLRWNRIRDRGEFAVEGNWRVHWEESRCGQGRFEERRRLGSCCEGLARLSYVRITRLTSRFRTQRTARRHCSSRNHLPCRSSSLTLRKLLAAQGIL